ncbi:hypothetical protein [Atopobium sp. oral taxon 810]|uniref:hypothetical protein n=1 Tax=Atopobium sp. oral taxon 810 TaxID=712158 RepID=UPI000395FEEF|nr:hypothetical protein [Atopobium sp. oral taxon 810]ERI06287.1 hypothetical protein HMPREF9069_00227 [Atopobium sp. oral taxon 810 str. F0209]
MAHRPRTVLGRRPAKGTLGHEEAEQLFSTVDETGHSNRERAARERKRRHEKGHGVDIDPLSDADPSGSDVELHIRRTAVGFVMTLLVVVILAQVSCGVVRRVNTANLSQDVSVVTVASALRGGVEWGNGFTQFPEDFTVQEADQHTHRVEVSVRDTTSKNVLTCFSSSQIQATALSVNALLNPNINTVIYHVNVYMDDSGNLLTSQFFNFIKPTGETHPFMTFIWTKENTSNGVRYNCTIEGMDAKTQKALRKKITSSYTPFANIGQGDSAATPTDEQTAATSETSDATL